MNQDTFQQLIKEIRSIDEGLLFDKEALQEGITSKYYISTQAPSLDWIIGQRGIPSARVTLVYGTEGSGKSTLVTHLLAECQRMGGLSVLMDTEYAYDPARSERIGVDNSSLLLLRPETMEEVFETLDKIIQFREKEPDIPILVVWDSVTATPVFSEISKKDRFYDLQPGQQAKVLSTNLRKLIRSIAAQQIAFVMVNQIRENVGVLYGPREVMPGGRAIKFYASLILKIKKTGIYHSSDDEPLGITCEVEVEKNKLAPPFRKTEININFMEGIDIPASYMDVALKLGIVERVGSWYQLADPYQKFHSKKFRAGDFKNIINQELKETIDQIMWGGR